MARVLIVDDNDSIRETLADAMRDEGHEVEALGEGAQAVTAALERPPDVILLDLMMPGMDGVDVARALAAGGSTAPIVVLSADRSGASRAASIGAKRFLAKPFDLEKLLRVISDLTGRPPS